jgi:hypothetical protein
MPLFLLLFRWIPLAALIYCIDTLALGPGDVLSRSIRFLVVVLEEEENVEDDDDEEGEGEEKGGFELASLVRGVGLGGSGG